MKKKVLLALSGFDIGGAEMHVLELAKELMTKEYEPIIVSAGGAYVEEAKRLGIQHITINLLSKSPIAMRRAYKQLKQLIVEKDIKLVHAHARIPGYIIGLLHKKLDFVFVTTVHAKFSTFFLYKWLSNWGEAALTVSQDLKQYLINCYNFDEKLINITVNGISSTTFNTQVNYSDVLEEFGIDKEVRKLVYVGRLDVNKNKSAVANSLVKMAPQIFEKYSNTQLIIVGGGTDYEAVRLAAEQMNKQLGRQYIVMTGARLDVHKFMAMAEVVIGVSRVALEGMATERIVILAGDEGGIGLPYKDRLDKIIATNFTCRDEEMLLEDRLVEEIDKALKLPFEEKNEIIKNCKAIVTERYSTERMALDAIELYEKAQKGHISRKK